MLALNKSVLVNGSGSPPNEHERVICTVSVHLDDIPRFDRIQVTFDVGHAEDFGVLRLVDTIVQTMKVGEECGVKTTALISLLPSEREQLQLAADQDYRLNATVQLHQVQRLNKFWEMSEADKLCVARVMKRRGNKLVEAREFRRAFTTYKIGIRVLEKSVIASTPICAQSESSKASDQTPSACVEARQLLTLCFANAAHCLLGLSAFFSSSDENKPTVQIDDYRYQLLRNAIELCQKAIGVDPLYPKSWLRLAKAYAKSDEYDEAVKAAEKCLQITENVESAKCVRECLNNLLPGWRKAVSDMHKSEQSTIRNAVLRRYYDDYDWSDDEMEKLPITIWSNSLAANMMSLHEELEAFGEKMPEPRQLLSRRSSHRLETLHSDEASDDPDNTFNSTNLS